MTTCFFAFLITLLQPNPRVVPQLILQAVLMRGLIRTPGTVCGKTEGT